MDGEQELTDAQAKQLTAALQALQESLQEQLATAAQAVQPVALDQQSVGRLSRMDAMQQQQMARASQRNLQLRSSQCAAALEAVARGDYGYCKRCEEPIGFKRLNARPEAPMCMVCQSASGR